MSRLEIPPPGQRLEFDQSCRVLTDELQRPLPDVRASMKRRGDRVTWRYGGLEVTATNDRGIYCVRLDPRFGGMQDAERHDAYTQRDHINIYGFRALVIWFAAQWNGKDTLRRDRRFGCR